MRYVLCAVWDQSSEVYGRVFPVRSESEAVRSFVDECGRKEDGNLLYWHAADFVLFRVGAFDDETGELLPESRSRLIAGSVARGIGEQVRGHPSLQTSGEAGGGESGGLAPRSPGGTD